jgi:inhibitor of cysteine peptidase
VVFIQSWTCDTNTLEQVTLDPGSSYGKNIILYIPKKDKTEPVTFRLGFKRMSEDGDIAEPLWSDPVTINVIVPDDMKEIPPATGRVDVAKSQKPAAVTPEETAVKKVTAGELESEVPAGGQLLAFQDPGVPIAVRPGQEFSISLGSDPSTGFRWKMTLPEGDKTVMLLGSEHVASRQVQPGIPGTEVFKFKALTRGETKADFVYERSWETQNAPTRKIFTIAVRED